MALPGPSVSTRSATGDLEEQYAKELERCSKSSAVRKRKRFSEVAEVVQQALLKEATEEANHEEERVGKIKMKK